MSVVQNHRSTMNAPPIAAPQLIVGSPIPRIVIRFVPQGDVRFSGLGDWRFDCDALQIRASGETEDEAFLIALHELVEAWLCRRQGVAEAAVDAHDLAFEAERAQGLHGPDDEPGEAPNSPYRKQHRKACLVEHLVANFLGLSDYGVVR